MKIVVTAHAKTRFRERFRLMFNSEIFKEGRDGYFMKGLFEKSMQVDFSFKQKIGLYNAICTRHKCMLDYHRYSDKFIFVSTIQNGVRNILTVLRVDQPVMGHIFP